MSIFDRIFGRKPNTTTIPTLKFNKNDSVTVRAEKILRASGIPEDLIAWHLDGASSAVRSYFKLDGLDESLVKVTRGKTKKERKPATKKQKTAKLVIDSDNTKESSFRTSAKTDLKKKTTVAKTTKTATGNPSEPVPEKKVRAPRKDSKVAASNLDAGGFGQNRGDGVLDTELSVAKPLAKPPLKRKTVLRVKKESK